jgi:hypothetical protein
MVTSARYALITLTVVVLAVFVPMLSDLAFGERAMKTQLFYSPVTEDFIWRDKMPRGLEVNHEEMHHAQFLITDRDGNRYERQDFEKLLPFIYYKNMELWGLLPIELKGESFDKVTIRSNRQVVELKPEQLPENSIGDEIYPLIDSEPDGVRLVLPDTRFRIGDRMEFVHADSNTVSEYLSMYYTSSLKEAGFVFPGEFVGGKLSVLKPFDEGVFLKDKEGIIFHMKSVKGQPKIVKTGINAEGGVRFLKVSESKRREFYGILLSNAGDLYMLGYDDYNLIPLPLSGYNPDTMDFKMIINPLYRTATYSDNEAIKAVVMDTEYQKIDEFEHVMPGTKSTRMQNMVSRMLPYRLQLKAENSEYYGMSLSGLSTYSLWSALVCVVVYMAVSFRRAQSKRIIVLDALFILFTGVYGLLAAFLIPSEN